MQQINKQKIDYHKITLDIIEEAKASGKTPTLLLHSCCAPCSSYVLSFLSATFKITISYYNPNIYPRAEFDRRLEELHRFVEGFPAVNPVEILPLPYDDSEFYSAVRGLENEREGGERCFACYRLRMAQAAKLAKEWNFDYFTTAMSISPHKNAAKINAIGDELAEKYGVKFLNSDFKKNEGFKRSLEFSKEYNLYRQQYCGCKFSYNDYLKREKSRSI